MFQLIAIRVAVESTRKKKERRTVDLAVSIVNATKWKLLKATIPRQTFLLNWPPVKVMEVATSRKVHLSDAKMDDFLMLSFASSGDIA